MNKAQFFFHVVSFLAAFVPASILSAAAPTIQPGSWTLAILPDTQNYTENYPEIIKAQTQFLANNKAALNLVHVLHEGDITDNNIAAQWTTASDAFKTLEDADLSFTLTTGNHDYGPNGNGTVRTTNMATYFPVSRLSQQSTYGGVYSAEPNSPCSSYSMFTAGGTDWLVLALEFGPRDQVVDWADSILKKYPDRQAMVVTHAYMYTDDTRYDYAAKGTTQAYSPYTAGLATGPGGLNDGQEIWDKLQDNPNLQFVFSGHMLSDGTGYLASAAENGNVVHQLLANYQFLPNGGNGYMRLLEFLPDGKTVHVRTYSPTLDSYLTGADQDFTITMTQVRVPEAGTCNMLLVAIGTASIWTFGKSYRRFARGTVSR